ncbi:cmgc/cdk/pitslre protein kinase [Loa loa]|uniref:cyclin-dependent kinase n=1 Tax=Loa loa TaxID=7209 RepID=A0A1I7VME4_LOALO|nr:cmgc/cdk/pitslre protein kinase [Loa loa]EFO27220.2 cmgc/cdk/pitslre protein kinase [Loa loa]
MNSPSDDGQYTDTDREEGAIDDDRKSSEGSTSIERPPVSCNSSDPNGHNIKVGKRCQENSSASSSDVEGEEARLRQKLLERRSVLNSSSALKREVIEVERGSTSSVSVTITNIDKKSKSKIRSISPKTKKSLKLTPNINGSSDDEEMFSIQPKEPAVKQRSHSARPHEYRERERGGLSDKIRKPEKTRDEKHWHKERKHDKHTHGDYSNRDYDSRETHKRHISGKHQQSREHESRLAGRVVLPDSKLTQKPSSVKMSYKERENHGELKAERLHHAKDASKGRSPRKREGNTSPKRAGVALEGEVSSKKMHMEKVDGTDVTVTNANDNAGKTEKTVPEVYAEIHSNKFDQATSTDEMDDEQPSVSQKATPMGPSKYSKFDSDPEDEQEEKDEAKHSGVNDKTEMVVDSASDAQSDVILRDLDEDSMDLLDFDEERMASLSPETRTRLEEEQQKRLIARLPVYYPGISGCRNVAEFECLNRIEEGTFGVVYRAKEKKTDEIVALKRLKMEKEKEGFPITSLREINMLLKAGNHPNIVNVREIVIGSNMDKIYLVMEYVEHDMKSLMDTMHSRGKRFRTGEVKTLLHQLLSGVAHMHDEWILHRDLKTSNLLLSHKGILKIGDFGLSREFGDPLKPYTPIVVTLWYRAPELLLGVKEYSTAVDMWSCGCIFAEFLKLKPLFPGKGEMDQINKIFTDLGTPDDKLWPGYSSLPGPRKTTFEHHHSGELEKKFPTSLVDERGLEFIKELLTYNPTKRISAHEALAHDWFERYPPPTPPEMFPTWPAKSELGKSIVKTPITKSSSKEMQNAKLYKELKVEPKKEASTSFALKFDVAAKFSK